MNEDIAEALQHIVQKAKMDCWINFHADADGMFFVWDTDEEEPMNWQSSRDIFCCFKQISTRSTYQF